MKYLSFLILPFLTAVAASVGFRLQPNPPTAAPDRKPNIIIILANDMGYADLGCMGSEVPTPNIDGLAKNGLLMTQFYNAGRCCPSRAALLTGLYPHQTGIGDMSGDYNHPAYKGVLNDKCITIAEGLKTAGYVTAHSGKWHVGDKLTSLQPMRRGFDQSYLIDRGGGIYYYPAVGPHTIFENDVPQKIDPKTYYSTEAINDFGVRFLEKQRNSDKPFFLYLAHIAPHFPLQAWPDDIARFRGRYRDGFAVIRQRRFARQQQLGLVPKGQTLSVPDDLVKTWNSLSEAQRDTFDLKMAVYAAQIACLDRETGKLVAKLKEIGQLENTVIFFLSDNGSSPEELPVPASNKSEPGLAQVDKSIGTPRSWAMGSPSWANVSNTPFRMYKQWAHEGGIATPLIVHYPALIKKKRLDNQVGHIMDILPTCLELAGATYPATYKNKPVIPVEGRSLVPILAGEKRAERPFLAWEHEGNRAIRQGNWKLVSKWPENQWQLFDMSRDRSEMNDLSASNRQKASELANQYQQWADKVGVLPWKDLEAIAKP